MIEQKNTKTAEILEQLQEGVKAVFDSDAYKQWLRFVSKFRHYSWANTLLIWMQAPESQFVASYSDFKNKHSRYVVKGAKQIRIICPHTIKEEDQDGNTRVYTGFHTGTLYRLEDTAPMRDNREDIPCLNRILDAPVDHFSRLVDVLIDISPVPVSFEDITSHFDLIQDQMLKLFDHDDYEFSNGFIAADTSVVCLGAFSSIYKQKASKKKAIGFGTHAEELPVTDTITADDLITFGLKPEVIGRMRIVQMEPPTIETYERLAEHELKRLEQVLNKEIEIDSEQLNAIASDALEAGQGCRYIKKNLLQLAECFIYEHPFDKIIRLDNSPAMC